MPDSEILKIIVSVKDQATGAISNITNSLSGLQKIAILAGSALGAIAVKKTIDAFASFDDALQKSIAIMGDVDEAMREKLAKTAREVAKELGISHEEAARSYYYLASAGFSAAESLKAMPAVAKLAKAGALDMAEATDIATDIMTAFGKKVEDLSYINDVLIATVTKSNTNLQQLGEAMKYLAPAAHAVGWSVEEMSAAVGLLSNAGMKASQAGTYLRQIIAQLLDPTDKAKDILANLGITVEDINPQMHSLADIIQTLNERGATADDIIKIFGTRAGQAILALRDQGAPALREFTEELKNAGGITEQVAKTQMESFREQMNKIKAQIQDVMIEIGSHLAPIILSLINKLSALKDRISVSLSPALQKLWSFISNLLLPALQKLWSFISNSLLPALLALASFIKTVVITTIYEFKDDIEKLKEKFRTLTEFISNKAVSALDQFKERLQDNESVSAKTSNVIRTFKQTLSSVWSFLKETFSPALRELWKGITDLYNAFKGLDSETQASSTIFKIFKTIAEYLANVTLETLKRSLQAIALVIKGLGYALQFLAFLINLVRAAIDDEISALDMLKQALSAILSAIKGPFTDAFNKAKAVITNFALTAFAKAREIGKAIIDGIKSGLSNLWNTLINHLVSPVEGAINWIKDKLKIGSPSKVFEDIGQSIVEGYKRGITTARDLTPKLPLPTIEPPLITTPGIRPLPTAAPAGGPITINVDLHGSVIKEEADIDRLVNEIERRVARRLR